MKNLGHKTNHFVLHRKKLALINTVSIGIIILGYALIYIVNLILARYLQVAIYGDWAIIFNIVTFGSTLMLLGSGDAILVFIPEYIANQDGGKVSGFLRYFITWFTSFKLVINYL